MRASLCRNCTAKSMLLICGCYCHSYSLHLAQLAGRASVRAQCRWAGYIAFLPKSCPGLPLFWAAEDLQRLKGSSALDKMTGRGCSYTRSMEQPSEAGPHSLSLHASSYQAQHAPRICLPRQRAECFEPYWIRWHCPGAAGHMIPHMGMHSRAHQHVGIAMYIV